MPRLNKLKMAKYLPIAYTRVCSASQLLGLPTPDKFLTKNCSISNDLLTIKSSDEFICSMNLESLSMTLVDGRVLTDHAYWELTEQLTEQGYYPSCGCIDCSQIRADYEANQVAEVSRQMDTFSVPIKLPKEQRINSTSAEANARLPKEYQVPKAIPVIVDYQALLTEPCYDDNND